MKDKAKVVVIGGGVVGVSALYHLARKGWGDDVVLLEKAELTSGSTWHAAGLLPLFNMSYSVGQVHKYSVNLYNELEEETGQPVGFAQVGNLRLAMNDDRMDEYYQYAATARTIGIDDNIQKLIHIIKAKCCAVHGFCQIDLPPAENMILIPCSAVSVTHPDMNQIQDTPWPRSAIQNPLILRYSNGFTVERVGPEVRSVRRTIECDPIHRILHNAYRCN